MQKIIDRRNKALGGQSYGRSEASISGIAWHYTAVARKERAFITGHENYWRNHHGWKRGGYHYYIDADGNIYQNYNLTTISNGVKGHNSRLVNISVEANSASDYSKAQIKARKDLTLYLMKRLNLPASAVKQHKEHSGASTSCAGYTKAQMDAFRKELSGGKAPVINTKLPSKGKTTNAVAKEVIAGSWGNGNDRTNRLNKAGYNASAVQKEVNKIASGQAPQPTVKPTLKSTNTIAKEVIAGKWGNGSDRTNSLKKAGYNPSTIQREVNRIAGGGSKPKPSLKSTNVVAREVIAGKWGNGSDRTNRLKMAGYNPSTIQREVNRIAGGGSKPKPSLKSTNVVAREVISGKWGNGNDRTNKLKKAGYNPSTIQREVNRLL